MNSSPAEGVSSSPTGFQLSFAIAPSQFRNSEVGLLSFFEQQDLLHPTAELERSLKKFVWKVAIA
jgi:hypothetical protein